MTNPIQLSTTSLYERIGANNLELLLTNFYSEVQNTPLLQSIFPEDLSGALEKQVAFMTGFLGGPLIYLEKYGHPRLRERHLAFEITPKRSAAWLECMAKALASTPQISHGDAQELHGALSRVAQHMINSPSS